MGPPGTGRAAFQRRKWMDMMSKRFWIRSIFKSALWITLLALMVISVITWIAAGRLLHPERRAFQAYQKDWLKHPAAHGMRVYSSRCAEGRVPCLFTAPDAEAGAKERGRALRKQLADSHLSLPRYGETQGILVLLHGRSGRKEDLLPIAERFAAAGFKCVIPDLPAHGDSPLKSAHFATTAIERDIASMVLADARGYFNEMQVPAGIWGISMGGAFAMRAASHSPSTWKAVVIVSSFDSLDGVVADKLAFLPKPLPAMLDVSLGWMTRLRGGLKLHEVQPGIWAKRVSAPTLIAHGDRDQVISMGQGRRLFEAVRSRDKSWLVVRGANHRNVLIGSTPLYASMSAWLIAHVR
jgi:alpha-beta hydrolase superfamily lysophospholipase